MMFLGLFALLGAIICIGWAVVSLFRKKGVKKPLIAFFICLVLFIVGVSSDSGNKKTSSDKKTTTTELTKEKEEENEGSVGSTIEKSKDETSDITILSEKPTSNQATTLQTLADMQFKEQYPYKGSKMHSILGVLQDWTSTDGETWFYKVEATIVNEFGAEKKANVEVKIKPESPESGYVEFLDY